MTLLSGRLGQWRFALLSDHTDDALWIERAFCGRKRLYDLWTFWIVGSSWNVMAQGDARVEKWRGNKRMEWVTSKRHMTAEHRLARAVQTLQADVYSSPASSRLNWHPRRFKWSRPFRRKTKSGFCACAITFQTQSTTFSCQMTLLVEKHQ
jgi:hypothetical protein